MSNSWNKIFFAFLLVFNIQLNAQDLINPELALSDSEDINEKLIVLKDISGELGIEDILQDHNQLKFSSTFDLTESNIFWGKVSFHNHLNRAKSYNLFVGMNDYIDAYYVSKGKLIYKAKSGYLYPGHMKDIEAGSYFIPVQIDANSTLDVYFRIEEKIHNSPEFNLKLVSGDKWTEFVFNKYIVGFTFQLILWAVIFYSLLMFAATRIKDFLIYSIYLFLHSITFLFFSNGLRELILQNIPWATSYFIPVVILTISAYWWFLQDFVNTRKYFPNQVLKIQTFIISNIALYVICILLIAFTEDINLVSNVVQVILGTNVVIILWFIYQIYQSKYILVKYFIYGTALFLILTVFELITWDANASTANFVKYGVLAEIIVFSFGLAHKKRLLSEEKKLVVDKQIDQLKVNESLAQWQKEELEKIIDNRTDKIKQKNKILKTAMKEAREAAKVKSDFLSVMSHEIRTPMNAVIGMIHLLLNESPKKSQMENLKTLKFSAENLLVLINDILDYSKVESGKVTLENIPFDLRELTNGIGNTYELKASENGIKFSVLIDQKIPASLKGDPARITQILNNLISNAIKFTPQGQVKLLINMINKTNNKVKIEFTIEDTGIGISGENLDLIFESFTQAHTDTSRVYGGTGLGLAITKKLITLFESQILVESVVGKGSKFSFSLLLEESAESPHISEEDQTEKILSIKNKNVLIVDDNYINLMMAKKFIEKWGMKCNTVESGKDALTSIFNVDYDLILMDLQMPEMDGYETTATIRSLESPNIKNIPIIAVSADTYENVRTKIYDVGMDNFLAKPFNPNDLLNLVYKYCTMSGQKKEF
ncbi:MAG: response regulator [Reichenbachiella sp.]